MTERFKSGFQITTNKKWNFEPNELIPEKQFEYIRELYNDKIVNEKSCKFIKQQIQQKLSSYTSQDITKNKYNKEEFINNNEVLQLMIDSENKCFYCKEKVYVLYENVREPKQWTLERIDNEEGHNKKNVVISCLYCNLRRRTMYYERFLFTKQLNILKEGTYGSPLPPPLELFLEFGLKGGGSELNLQK